jgi:hypothetical protein
MDPHTYQRWWALHLRTARRENLTAEEKAFYEAGLKQLHQEEVRANRGAGLRELRAATAALQAEHAQLHAQCEKLDAEIMALEATLDERARQLLGIEE